MGLNRIWLGVWGNLLPFYAILPFGVLVVALLTTTSLWVFGNGLMTVTGVGRAC